MKRIKTLVSRDLEKSAKTGGCGECQTSCQSACKTSCSVANQQCDKIERVTQTIIAAFQRGCSYFLIMQEYHRNHIRKDILHGSSI